MARLMEQQHSLPVDTDALLARYGHDELRYAMAYGSGAVEQNGYSKNTKPMIDFVLAVDDAETWHRRNMAANPDDYSFLKHFGAKAVRSVQEMGAGVYYNPYVRFGDREIKYGVIETRRLLNDLVDWETLYVSGRMHKPVGVVRPDPVVEFAQQCNKQHAVDTARLLLPEYFHEEELYRTITGLSYAGDVRMGVGENPHKVENIVAANFDRLRSMYGGIVEKTPTLMQMGEGRIQQPQDPVEQQILIDRLPKGVKQQLPETTGGNTSPDELATQVRTGLRNIVGQSSMTMTLKGLLTAGPLRSIRYVSEKLSKRLSATS
jgi:translocator assembly and maintenance protein 41